MNANKPQIYKILIYGEPYNWAMACNIKMGLEKLGHTVEIFDWTQWLYRTKKYNFKNRVLDRILFSLISRNINQCFIKQVKENSYDLIIVSKGIHIFPSTVLEAKKHVSFIVNWNPDDFFNPLNNSRYLLESFDKYDYILTSRKHLKEEYYKKGAKKVEIIHWYYLPQYFSPLDVSVQEKKKYGSDIVFVGTWSSRREDILSTLTGFNLRVWGASWGKAGRVFRNNIECNQPIFAEELCKTIISAKINLNILTKENRDTTNVRNFEVPACGGFQLSERSKEILDFYEEDKEIVCFETVEELVSKCKYYLSHEPERERIRTNGYNRLINGHHSIYDRTEQLLDVIFA